MPKFILHVRTACISGTRTKPPQVHAIMVMSHDEPAACCLQLSQAPANNLSDTTYCNYFMVVGFFSSLLNLCNITMYV